MSGGGSYSLRPSVIDYKFSLQALISICLESSQSCAQYEISAWKKPVNKLSLTQLLPSGREAAQTDMLCRI